MSFAKLSVGSIYRVYWIHCFGERFACNYRYYGKSRWMFTHQLAILYSIQTRIPTDHLFRYRSDRLTGNSSPYLHTVVENFMNKCMVTHSGSNQFPLTRLYREEPCYYMLGHYSKTIKNPISKNFIFTVLLKCAQHTRRMLCVGAPSGRLPC